LLYCSPWTSFSIILSRIFFIFNFLVKISLAVSLLKFSYSPSSQKSMIIYHNFNKFLHIIIYWLLDNCNFHH
jgi:hypothetical protein